MRVEFVNGYKHPRFDIRDAGNKNSIDLIDLDLTNSPGLLETYKRIRRRKTDLNFKLKEKFKGYRNLFTFPYDKWSRAVNTLKIRKLFDYGDEGRLITLMPRSDADERSFACLNDTDELNIGIIRGDFYSPGNKLIIIRFICIDLTPRIPILDYNAHLDNFQPTGEGIDNIL